MGARPGGKRDIGAAARHDGGVPRDLADELPLRSRTTRRWAEAALADPLALLDDHAHLERKAAANALALWTRAPVELDDDAHATWTRVLASVARDEAEHLALVVRVLARRGGVPSRRHRNAYAAALHRHVRTGAGRDEVVDHLLVCALIEARSCERFEALAAAATDEELRALFHGLCASERGHHRVFLELAAAVAGPEAVRARFDALLGLEALDLAAQPPGPRVHAGEPR